MRYIAIHHSAINDEDPQFERVKGYHNAGAPKDGKIQWPKGFGIQYTIFIERSGEKIQSYDLEKVTWHSGSSEWNIKSFAVCLAGDLRKQKPTSAQMISLFRTWKESGFPPIVYHREIRPAFTACPGQYQFREELESLKIADLEIQLKLAERALPRFEGTPRGNLLSRFITRLKRILLV